MTLMRGKQMALFILILRSRHQIRDDIRPHAASGPNRIVSENGLFLLSRLYEQ